jgi:glucokinase
MEKKPNSEANEIVIGLDIGGTKIHALNTTSFEVGRYPTDSYDSLDAFLASYLAKLDIVPSAIAVAMAGPRNDNDGSIKMTNSQWPTFYPAEFRRMHPQTSAVTANDMVATIAGVISGDDVSLVQLKPGVSSQTGTKIVVTISTGVGVAAAVWNEQAGEYTFMQAEGGHMGFQPRDEMQSGFLDYLRKIYKHPSVELAISGKRGIDNLVDYLLPKVNAPQLSHAIDDARSKNIPTGAVLLQFANADDNEDRAAARQILDSLGSLVGNVLADFALAYKATGGIYLTGSVSVALAEYWANNTKMNADFIRSGTEDYAIWLDAMLGDVPIYLITDNDIAVKGALELAKAVDRHNI